MVCSDFHHFASANLPTLVFCVASCIVRTNICNAQSCCERRVLADIDTAMKSECTLTVGTSLVTCSNIFFFFFTSILVFMFTGPYLYRFDQSYFIFTRETGIWKEKGSILCGSCIFKRRVPLTNPGSLVLSRPVLFFAGNVLWVRRVRWALKTWHIKDWAQNGLPNHGICFFAGSMAKLWASMGPKTLCPQQFLYAVYLLGALT